MQICQRPLPASHFPVSESGSMMQVSMPDGRHNCAASTCQWLCMCMLKVACFAAGWNPTGCTLTRTRGNVGERIVVATVSHEHKHYAVLCCLLCSTRPNPTMSSLPISRKTIHQFNASIVSRLLLLLFLPKLSIVTALSTCSVRSALMLNSWCLAGAGVLRMLTPKLAPLAQRVLGPHVFLGPLLLMASFVSVEAMMGA